MVVCSISPALLAQDETVSGNLTVNGRADVLTGPFSLGTASFFDDLNAETSAEGLTIRYSETPQIWSGGNSVPGRSTIVHQVGQELADFLWQTSAPDGMGGFTGVDLLKLSSEQFRVTPPILGLATLNTLPNQTLTAGNASILTLGLADNRYLGKAGGTISGNLVVTGSATISSLAGNFSGTGTDNRLPNQVADHADSIMTQAAGDVRYLHSGYAGAINLGLNSYSVPNTTSIAMGYYAHANVGAISIGDNAGYMGVMVSGVNSVALGYAARAPGINAIGIGMATWALGEDSVSLGSDASSGAVQSIAIGKGTRTSRLGQVVLGSFNNPQDWLGNLPGDPQDHLFVIGNGTAENTRSNALVVKRNGNMEVKGSSLTVNGEEVLTNSRGGYVKVRDDNTIIGGYQAFAPDWGFGIAIGPQAHAKGTFSIAIGTSAGNMGEGSIGEKSISLGYSSRSPGANSIAIGESNWSAGVGAVAIGQNASAYWDGAVALGTGARANQMNQVVLGAYNVQSPAAATLSPEYDLFILGNGSADDARSNALVVKRNGNMEVKGSSLTVNGSQVLTETSGDYIRVTPTGEVTGGGASVTPWSGGIGIGGSVVSGNQSVGIGNLARAIGDYSVAMGREANVGGEHAIGIGYGSFGAGDKSIAIGGSAATHTAEAIAIGNEVRTTQIGQIVLGNFNEMAPYSPLVASPTDWLFSLGNGTADNARSNALVVKRNGNMEVKGSSLTVNGQEVLTAAALTTLTYNGTSLLTQSSADTRYLTQSQATADYLTTSAAATAYQAKPAAGVSFLTSEDLVAIQADIDAKIDAAELEDALENIDLSGNYLSKDPQVGLAYGSGSTAMAGTSAVGSDAVANQAGAHALGSHVVANRPGQIVVGSYNDYGSTQAGSSTEADEDPVFVVGTGKAGASGQPDERKNALIVKRNGNVDVTGVLRVEAAGNLSMGDFQEGPRPVPEEE